MDGFSSYGRIRRRKPDDLSTRHSGVAARARLWLPSPAFLAMPATFSPSGQSDQFPFALVRPELERVEAAIREQVRAFDPAVEPYVSYVCNTSGKRIRPSLAILVGGATG